MDTLPPQLVTKCAEKNVSYSYSELYNTPQRTYQFSNAAWNMEEVFLSVCGCAVYQRATGFSPLHISVQFSLEILKNKNMCFYASGYAFWGGNECSYCWHVVEVHGREKHSFTKSAHESVFHPHLSSFSCGTLKAASHDEWGLSVVAVVAPGCHHWGILAYPAPTTAQGHSWAYTRPLRDAGSPEALTASRPLAARDSGRHQSNLDRLHRA